MSGLSSNLFIAGPYSLQMNVSEHAASASFSTLGIIEDAPRVEFTNSSTPIVGDNLGDAVQDMVYRGGNMYIDLVLQQANLDAVKKAFWPYANGSGTYGEFGEMGVVGQIMGTRARSIHFTEINSTTTATPTTIAFDYTVLAPGFPLAMLFGSRLRNVPLRLQCLPYRVDNAAGNDERNVYFRTDVTDVVLDPDGTDLTNQPNP